MGYPFLRKVNFFFAIWSSMSAYGDLASIWKLE